MGEEGSREGWGGAGGDPDTSVTITCQKPSRGTTLWAWDYLGPKSLVDAWFTNIFNRPAVDFHLDLGYGGSYDHSPSSSLEYI